MPKKKKTTQMQELTKGYNDFIKDKQVNPDGKKLFKKVLKKATTKRSNSK